MAGPRTGKRDLYDVLGIERGANEEEVRKAYRKKALEFHPDRNKSEGASDRFKEVNEAYQVLSDPEQRSRYDRFGHRGVDGNPGRGFDGFGDIGGFGDIFESFFGGATSNRPARGRDLEIGLEVPFRDAIFGANHNRRIRRRVTCDRCDGTRAEPGSTVRQCGTCDGTGQVRRTARVIFGNFEQISECPTCAATGTIINDPCSGCRGLGVVNRDATIQISVPSGIEDGTRIVMRGHGDVGEHGAEPGDLFVRLHVQDDDLFVRRGNDIYITMEIHAIMAMLGDKVTVPTLEGDTKLDVKPGAQTGATLTIPGAGVPHLHNDARRGDQIVSIYVKTPERFTKRQSELLRELAESFAKENGRPLDPEFVSIAKPRGGKQSGIWDWLRSAFMGD